MPDILLFGATGYTGKLTAAALHARGADFAIAGRNRAKLEALASATGSPPIQVVEVGDVEGLALALDGCRVLITCVGPFTELGWTAVEAALKAGVNYLDTTGEGAFIERLISEYDEPARSRGIAMAPAMGFDEVPGDVVTTMASEGLERPAITVTYAVPRSGSAGTTFTTLGITTTEAPFLIEGENRHVRAGRYERWSPMPPPLGPRRAVSYPFALLRLAPRHLDMSSFETYVASGGAERLALRFGFPLLKVLATEPASAVIEKVIRRGPEGPDAARRAKGRWTILAEARSGSEWRNVTAAGVDVYGLTAEILAGAAMEMAAPGYDRVGVLSPVQAIGLAPLQEELARFGVTFDTYAPV